MDSYTQEGQWSGYSVREASTGYVVESWSRRSGDLSGRRVLLSYGRHSVPTRGADLAADYNKYMSVGGYLATLAKAGVGRVLRRGMAVC